MYTCVLNICHTLSVHSTHPVAVGSETCQLEDVGVQMETAEHVSLYLDCIDKDVFTP